MTYIHINERDQSSNNLRVLKLRKNEFKTHLINCLEITGFVFIILLYLKNCSFIRFGIRIALHSIISNPFPKDYSFGISDQFRKQVTKQLFYMSIFINILFISLDLIVGVPASDDPNWFYGSLTLQIIGDSKPSTRLTYLYYNIIVFGIQYCLLYLSMILNVNEEINSNNEYDPESMSYSINDIEGDGYTGQSTVAKISPMIIYDEIKTYSNIDVNDETTNAYMGNRLTLSSLI